MDAQLVPINLAKLAETTWQETAQYFGLPPTNPGNHRSDGNQASHALTFKLDHLNRADHQLKIVSKELHSKIQSSLNSLFGASRSHPFFSALLDQRFNSLTPSVPVPHRYAVLIVG